MKIIIAGGSGFIGGKLIARLGQSRHDLILLSRRPDFVKKSISGAEVLYWDAKTSNRLAGALEGADAVVNLVGASIASGRWTSHRKQEIFQSRIESTRALVNAIGALEKKPSVFVNASAVGYYGDCGEKAITEMSPKGRSFLADVCEQWEAEAMNVQISGVRVVLLRSGLVLDGRDGALQRMLLPFRLFVGGRLGSGTQWFPWIHSDDEISAIVHALHNSSVTGPVNLVAPGIVRMEEFCKELGKALHRPSWLSLPPIVLKIGLGEMAGPLLLHSQKVAPKKLAEDGFVFRFPTLNEALTDLMRG
jgi:uncharacterized protein (TIGR01777 family)